MGGGKLRGDRRWKRNEDDEKSSSGLSLVRKVTPTFEEGTCPSAIVGRNPFDCMSRGPCASCIAPEHSTLRPSPDRTLANRHWVKEGQRKRGKYISFPLSGQWASPVLQWSPSWPKQPQPGTGSLPCKRRDKTPSSKRSLLTNVAKGSKTSIHSKGSQHQARHLHLAPSLLEPTQPGLPPPYQGA